MANLLGKTMNTKVPLHLLRFLFPAHLALRILFCLCSISFEHVNDDLGQQIGKIKYHYFQKKIQCFFQIKISKIRPFYC